MLDNNHLEFIFINMNTPSGYFIYISFTIAKTYLITIAL